MYSFFLKEERKKRRLTIEKLSKITDLSLGAISQLENSNNIVSNSKVTTILSVYKYDDKYLKCFDEIIEPLIQDFFDAINYMDSQKRKMIYEEIKKHSISYEDTPLNLCFKMCDFLFTVCTYTNPILSLKDDLKYFDQYNQFLNDKYKCILILYIGVYYMDLKDYAHAKEYLKKANLLIGQTTEYNGLLNYFKARYAIMTGDIFSSMTYSKKAIEYFEQDKNSKRALNARFTVTIQYMKLRNYNKAIEESNKIYEIALSQGLSNEAAKAMFNAGYSSMFKRDFKHADECFTKIPKKHALIKHLTCTAFNKLLLNELEEMNNYCQLIKAMKNNEAYNDDIEMLCNYYQSKNLEQFVKIIEKKLKKSTETRNTFDREFMFLILIEKYKELKKYKKVAEYFELLYNETIQG